MALSKQIPILIAIVTALANHGCNKLGFATNPGSLPPNVALKDCKLQSLEPPIPAGGTYTVDAAGLSGKRRIWIETDSVCQWVLQTSSWVNAGAGADGKAKSGLLNHNGPQIFTWEIFRNLGHERDSNVYLGFAKKDGSNMNFVGLTVRQRPADAPLPPGTCTFVSMVPSGTISVPLSGTGTQGGTIVVVLATNIPCAWTAASDLPFVTLSASSGTATVANPTIALNYTIPPASSEQHAAITVTLTGSQKAISFAVNQASTTPPSPTGGGGGGSSSTSGGGTSSGGTTNSGGNSNGSGTGSSTSGSSQTVVWTNTITPPPVCMPTTSDGSMWIVRSTGNATSWTAGADATCLGANSRMAVPFNSEPCVSGNSEQQCKANYAQFLDGNYSSGSNAPLSMALANYPACASANSANTFWEVMPGSSDGSRCWPSFTGGCVSAGTQNGCNANFYRHLLGKYVYGQAHPNFWADLAHPIGTLTEGAKITEHTLYQGQGSVINSGAKLQIGWQNFTPLSRQGYAMTFDGVGAVSFPATAIPKVELGTGDFTISFWINAAANGPDQSYAVAKRSGCNRSSFWDFVVTRGYIGFELQDSNIDPTYGLSAPLSAGVWHLVTATSTGGNVLLYVDGAQAASLTLNRGIPNLTDPSAPLQIGTSSCVGVNGAQPFIGSIADVTVWNYAMTAAQISAMYK